jgi:folate-binding protein YgfZ
MRIYSPSAPIQWSWVTLAGPDAKDFLQRLTTVNTRDMEVGQGAPGFFLNAQGKVKAYFHLWNYASGEYAFEFDAGNGMHWKQELIKTVDAFTFAEKQTLIDVTALQSLWIFEGSVPGLEAGKTFATDAQIRFCHHGDRDFGRSWISAWGTPEKIAEWKASLKAEPVAHEQLEHWRVLALRPWINSEIDENTNPLEVGMRDGIADNKGCYPGQEVIEKIISLGSPAKRLALIEGKGTAPQPGEPIRNNAEPPMEVGSVTSVLECEGSFSALALVKKIHAKAGNAVRTTANTTATIVRVTGE